MEGGNISQSSRSGQACIFEDLLVSRPTGATLIKSKYYEKTGDWKSALKLWRPNDLPLKSLIDSVERLHISTEVITFLNADAVEPIYQWLVRKGVMTNVEYYESIEDYSMDLRYNRSITTVYVAKQEDALILGPRSTVVSPTTEWGRF